MQQVLIRNTIHELRRIENSSRIRDKAQGAAIMENHHLVGRHKISGGVLQSKAGFSYAQSLIQKRAAQLKEMTAVNENAANKGQPLN